ncbi:hypothetical protein [Euzebya rosea]|uniref:hypothetical protein n=1 Tax=Euzebya rosea TaxID=2052804 RepID=UPI001475A80C|nr:hypothetical protein [Euzebya rosea]
MSLSITAEASSTVEVSVGGETVAEFVASGNTHDIELDLAEGTFVVSVIASPDDAREILDAFVDAWEVIEAIGFERSDAQSLLAASVMHLCTEWLLEPEDFDIDTVAPTDAQQPTPAPASTTRIEGRCHGTGVDLYCASGGSGEIFCTLDPTSDYYQAACGDPEAIVFQGDGCFNYGNADVDCGPEIETWAYGTCSPHPTDGDVVCTDPQGDYFCRESASPLCGMRVLRDEEMDCSIYWDGSRQCF